MKTHIAIAATLVLALLPVKMSAQMDEHIPGIYTIIDDDYVPLNYTAGVTSVSTTGIGDFEYGDMKHQYKGETSGVNASETFVLVIDPEKKVMVRTLKKYDPFIKTMTPNNVLVLPLTVNERRHRREYDQGRNLNGFNIERREMMDFEWEQITDNSFMITVPDLLPGEYAFIFRATRLAEFDYTGIFGFTIAPTETEFIDQ